MSDDEIVVLIASGLVAPFAIWGWYHRLAGPHLAAYPGNWRSLIGVAPLAALGVIFAVLVTLAAQDVRTAPQYILLYLLLGAVWVFYATQFLALLGVSVRDDAVERRNPAAALLVICAMLSHAIIFSGANIGDGPGWWVVVITGTLSAGSWFILWFMVEAFCDVHERVTVDRDMAAAIRFGGLALAMAIVLARAAAGDWVSFAETLRDFSVAWPAVLLAGLGIVIERSLGASRTSMSLALLLAAAFIGLAVFAVATSGPLSHNPDYGPPEAWQGGAP